MPSGFPGQGGQGAIAVPPAGTFAGPLSAGYFTAEGDSLTVGFGASQGWPAIFQTNNPAPHVHNQAASGDAFQTNILNEAASTIDPDIHGGAPWNICVIWAGTNDIWLLGHDGATVAADMQTWCTGRKTAGWTKVVACNCIFRNNLSDAPNQAVNEGHRQIFNAAIAASHPWCDLMIDLATPLGDPTSNPSYWQSDQTHITDAGEALVASLVESAMRATFGSLLG